MSILKEYEQVYLSVAANKPGLVDKKADTIAKFKMAVRRWVNFPKNRHAEDLVDKYAARINQIH